MLWTFSQDIQSILIILSANLMNRLIDSIYSNNDPWDIVGPQCVCIGGGGYGICMVSKYKLRKIFKYPLVRNLFGRTQWDVLSCWILFFYLFQRLFLHKRKYFNDKSAKYAPFWADFKSVWEEVGTYLWEKYLYYS